MCMYANTYLHTMTINEKSTMNLEEHGKVHYMGVFKMEEREGRNAVIKSQFQKNNKPTKIAISP